MVAVLRRTSAGAVALGFTLLALVLTGLAAWALAHNQADQRRDLRARYVDRTVVASSLLDSLFRVAFTSQTRDASERFAGKVDTARLNAKAARGQTAYVVIADASGRVLAASRKAPPRPPGLPAHLRTALRG